MKMKIQGRPVAVDEPTAAAMLGISPRTMFALGKEGRVPYFRLGRAKRYRVSALEEFARQAEKADIQPGEESDEEEENEGSN
ncbi:MAG: helix-turn-helix domain-containing protein [Phycisphaerae bacterium]